MLLCTDGEISSSVVLVITTIKRRGGGVYMGLMVDKMELWQVPLRGRRFSPCQ